MRAQTCAFCAPTEICYTLSTLYFECDKLQFIHTSSLTFKECCKIIGMKKNSAYFYFLNYNDEKRKENYQNESPPLENLQGPSSPVWHGNCTILHLLTVDILVKNRQKFDKIFPFLKTY